jgi:hypothetical protein
MVIPKGSELQRINTILRILAFCAQGQVIVRTDEGSKFYLAPACIEIKADEDITQLKALQDCVWYRVHATDEERRKQSRCCVNQQRKIVMPFMSLVSSPSVIGGGSSLVGGLLGGKRGKVIRQILETAQLATLRSFSNVSLI